jgi:hypothetical protein
MSQSKRGEQGMMPRVFRDGEDEGGGAWIHSSIATYPDISVCCRIKKSLGLRAFDRNTSRAFL